MKIFDTYLKESKEHKYVVGAGVIGLALIVALFSQIVAKEDKPSSAFSKNDFAILASTIGIVVIAFKFFDLLGKAITNPKPPTIHVRRQLAESLEIQSEKTEDEYKRITSK